MIRFFQFRELKKPFLRVFHTIKKLLPFPPLPSKGNESHCQPLLFFPCKVNEHSAQISDSYCTEAYAYLY